MYHDPLVTRVGVPDWLVPVGPCVPPLGVGTIDLPDFSDSDGEDSDADDEDAGGSVQHPSECGTFLRNASRRLPAVAAWHGAVPCAAVRAALEADAKLLVRAATASTFWLEAADAPRCLLESFARSVLDFHAPRCMHATAHEQLRGVEWWVQARASDGAQPSLGLHWDADEKHKAEVGEPEPAPGPEPEPKPEPTPRGRTTPTSKRKPTP